MSKLDETIAAYEEWMLAQGYICCEECSTPNWKSWHKPGEHNKLNGEALDQMGNKVKMYESVDFSKVGKG